MVALLLAERLVTQRRDGRPVLHLGADGSHCRRARRPACLHDHRGLGGGQLSPRSPTNCSADCGLNRSSGDWGVASFLTGAGSIGARDR